MGGTRMVLVWGRAPSPFAGAGLWSRGEWGEKLDSLWTGGVPTGRGDEVGFSGGSLRPDGGVAGSNGKV